MVTPDHTTARNPVANKHCCVIAEAGVNHNGQLDLAKALVDAAVEAGADVVKFQTFKAENLATRSASRAPYQLASGTTSQYEMLKSLELAYEYHGQLKSYSEESGIEFMSTAYDEEAARFLKELGVRRIKIASADIVNKPLLEAVADTGLPVIQSTGMATLNEVERAVDLLRNAGTKDLTLLHCVTSYPLDMDQVNMRWMATLKQAFQLPTGYSDHTSGTEMPIMAVSLGAEMIEKHLTLDRSMAGPDHSASLEPNEFLQMVRAIRNVEQAFGDSGFGRADQEVGNIFHMRKSIYSARPIRAGQTIRREDLAFLRPYQGLDPWEIDLVIGRQARIDIDKEHPITWDVI